MIMRMKSNTDNFVDSYISNYIDDTLNDYKYKFIQNYAPYYKKNTNKNTSGDEQQQDTSKVRFLDKYPEDRKDICVTMEVDDRTMILIGTYHCDKQVILNGAIGIFQIHPNDTWTYVSDLKD